MRQNKSQTSKTTQNPLNSQIFAIADDAKAKQQHKRKETSSLREIYKEVFQERKQHNITVIHPDGTILSSDSIYKKSDNKNKRDTNYFNFLPPAQQKILQQACKEAIHTCEHQHCEFLLEIDDALHSWSYQIVPITQQGITEKLMIVATDTTTERALFSEREVLFAELTKRNKQLSIAEEIAEMISTSLKPGKLMQKTVNILQKRFGFYYVGIFLSDENGKNAVLTVGTGKEGKEMIANNHFLAIGGKSLIGQCVANKTPIFAHDVGKEAFHFNNPSLPETRSELVIPIKRQNAIIGALTVQSKEKEAYSREDIAVMQTVIDYLSIALENAHRITELQEHDRFLREVIDLVPHRIYAKDKEGRFLLVNKAKATAFGMDIDEIVGKKQTEISGYAEEAKKFLADDQEIIRTKKATLNCEEMYTTEAGEQHISEISKIPYTIPGSKETAVLGISVNVTQRKKTEEALRESIRNNEALLKALPDLIFVLDKSGTYLDYHATNTGTLAFPPEKLVGMNIKDMPVEEEKKKQMEQCIKSAIVTGEMQTIEYSLKTLEGDGSFEARVVKLNKNEVLALVRDITERRRVEKTKENFISLASHQLRTPLTVINGYLEMLIDEGYTSFNKQQQKFITGIAYGARRMNELVNGLLQISRIELGTWNMDPQEVDIHTLLDAEIEGITHEVRKKKLRIAKKYDKSIPLLQIDTSAVQVIVQNLLSNAVKYTPKKGTITIKTKLLKNKVKIVVKDTGCGIAKKDKRQIFTKFFRAPNARKMEANGNGIGLYIVKTIVEELGGAIGFISVEGKGTSFYFTMPI